MPPSSKRVNLVNKIFMQNDGQKNIESVACFYEAIARGDLATARRLLDREVEWIEADETTLWLRGTHPGACAVLNEVILPAYGAITDFRMESAQLSAVGEHVVVIGCFRGHSKTTGKELAIPTTQVWTLREGKAMRVQTFNDPCNWSKVLGQPEIEQVAA